MPTLYYWTTSALDEARAPSQDAGSGDVCTTFRTWAICNANLKRVSPWGAEHRIDLESGEEVCSFDLADEFLRRWDAILEAFPFHSRGDKNWQRSQRNS